MYLSSARMFEGSKETTKTEENKSELYHAYFQRKVKEVSDERVRL